MKLTIAAIVSTIAAMVFCLGYLGSFGVIATNRQFNGVDRIHYGVHVDRGSFVLWKHDRHLYRPLPGLGWSVYWVAHPEPPLLRLCIWYVEAGSNPIRNTSEYGVMKVLAFPAWCPLLPCLISPLLWLRRRRLRKQPAAFAVITDQKN